MFFNPLFEWICGLTIQKPIKVCVLSLLKQISVAGKPNSLDKGRLQFYICESSYIFFLWIVKPMVKVKDKVNFIIQVGNSCGHQTPLHAPVIQPAV